MKLIRPRFKIMEIMGGFDPTPDGSKALQLIEYAGRTCYKSAVGSAEDFAKRILKNGHESVIEHSALTIKFNIDRGVSHELVRHRLCAFSQESTRYCNYKGGVMFILPSWLAVEQGDYECLMDFGDWRVLAVTTVLWIDSMFAAETAYKRLLEEGWSPQKARSVLPNSLATEIVVTANLREWRHIFKLRTAAAAHPQMREIMLPTLQACKQVVPVIFDDIGGQE